MKPDAFVRRPAPEASNLLEETVIAAMIVLAENKQPQDAIIREWKKAALNVPDGSAMTTVLTDLENALLLPEADLAGALRETSTPQVARLLAAVRISTGQNSSLVTMFAGQAFLLNYLITCSMRQYVEDRFANLVRADWVRRISFSAEFLAPRITVPAIQAACNDGPRGLQRAARVLLQARFAVRINIPPEVVEAWNKLAAN